MEIERKKKEELEELISMLEDIRGMHTELVTVLIPAGTNIHQVSTQLSAERSTAENIKSKQTRTAVTTALDMIIRKLKEYKQTPLNGLAIFCGNISKKEGVQNIQIWAYEPPIPLRVRIYRCDKNFVLEPLKEMLETQEAYGLLVIDRQQATIGILEGKQIKVIRVLTSGVPGKIKAGGQCLTPDAKIDVKDKGGIALKDINEGDYLEGVNLDTLEKMYNKCKKRWDVEKNSTISIITDGEFPSSHMTASADHIFYLFDKQKSVIEKTASELKVGDFLIGKNKKLIKILEISEVEGKEKLIDIEVENKNFFANDILVHNSSQRFHRITEGLAKEFFRKVAEAMKEIFFDMPKLKGILIGGPIPTKEDFLDEGELVTKLKEKVIAVKDIGYVDEHGLKLLVEASQEDISQQELVKEKNILNKFFETLGKHKEKAVYGMEKTKLALERGAVGTLLISKKLPKEQTKELEKMAENIGSEVVIISTENQEGEQFLNLTKGVGAILRFALE